jgi:hypothetical protein
MNFPARCIGKTKFMFSSTISAGIDFSSSFVSDPPFVFPPHSDPADPARHEEHQKRDELYCNLGVLRVNDRVRSVQAGVVEPKAFCFRRDR